MGKSTAASLLAELNVSVIDTDDIAREVVEPGQPALADVVACFGTEMIGDDGRLRRDELARRVFQNEEARRQLEAILHPRIRQVWLAQVKLWRRENRRMGAVVIPLLFETDAAPEFDETICIACSAATQLQRLRLRGWTEAQSESRIRAQWSVEKKIRCADYVVWTEGSLLVLAEQLKRVLQIVEGVGSP